MNSIFLTPGNFPQEFLRPTVEFLLLSQTQEGEIPWFEGGHSDPWDHTEAAMGLALAGELSAARRAYRWLANTQLEDGSWWRCYREGKPHEPDRRESNYVAYMATGVWHYYLLTADREFLQELFPTIDRAMAFVLSLQSEHGDIDWAVDADGSPKGDALVTGCSSIYKSMECALHIAAVLDTPRPHWQAGRALLGDALRARPDRFDRTWASKSRYAMDWFYPVLTGVIEGDAAVARINDRWHEFVQPGLGCRCEVQEPWVTVAESCELVLALMAVGDQRRAALVFSWLLQWRADDGAWWTGYQFADKVLWPDEKPTWTAGAVLLAADALTGFSGASRLFLDVVPFGAAPAGHLARTSAQP
ncbi:conserved hypothetical protein [Luminiphilus syltensis NOR5-1B]|uniref:Prenyltransferase n=1 Tax=Luminiphilus syltensis NOR5-1B TaxID=565045 RepID=B8KUL6_9GAMM|nr:hypothetical protein [Luminiphilus syltensis]EED34769.1 conserved hypothetical protein [Luminiphilus syltensis NOR5-1B]